MNIRKLPVRFIIITLINLVLFVSCQKDDSLPVHVNPAFKGLDSVVKNQMVTYNIPAASIAIVRNEKLVYVNSYGYSNKKTGKKATNNDLYRIASI